MKVLFLDIDGVLNSNFWNDSHQCEISDGSLIDKYKVKLLQDIIVNTEANIVMHSGWRFWFDDSLQPIRKESKNLVDMLEEYDLQLYDKTPDLTTDEVKRTKKFSLVKAKEILAWLDQHSDVTAFLILDDLDLHSEYIAKNQIRTNPEIGLTELDVKNAIRKLNA